MSTSPSGPLSLVWFRRDLRVQDHPALTRAAAEGPVLPVYILEPAAWAADDASGRHYAFLDEALRALREDLAALGQSLILRSGEAVEVLARLRAKHRVTRIVTHPETGTAAERARFERVALWAREAGLDMLIVSEDEGAPGAPPLPAPMLAPVTEGTGALPGPRILGLDEDPCRFRQPGGRATGLQMLDSFLASRGQGYAPSRATALEAERQGARLSPYLALGLISAREIRAALALARRQRQGDGEWLAALRALALQLRLRDRARMGPLEQPASQAVATGPWAQGETGLPYVDAAMRALAASGWLDGRSRALLAGVGVHHLRLDRAAVGNWLARMSTDYDPAIHWREMGRVVNGPVVDPVASGRQLDPDGSFIRRWLPELKRLPARHLHAPWLWPQARDLLAGRYPEPVFDPATTARAARALKLRAAPARRPARAQPAEDPLIDAPRTRPAGRQMSLDL